jgi:hypothetical protein
MRRLVALLALACLSAPLAACGDDETTTSAPAVSTTSTGATGATGAGGAPGPISAADVAACLDTAGFEATPSDAELVGVESAYERLDVARGDLDQAAIVVVFESDADAQAEEPNLEAAAGVADVKAAGNVVYGFDAAADFSPAEELVVKGCLPAG